MLSNIDHFYLDKEEPLKSCLIALRDIIMRYKPGVTTAWKYSAPFFLYNGKRFCYLWFDKKTMEPYIGITDGNKIDHPSLEKGNRIRMKILRIDPRKDIQLNTIYEIFDMAIAVH